MSTYVINAPNICSAALTRIGANNISSLAEDTTEALIANQNYEIEVVSLLTRYPWRFAAKRVELSKLGEDAQAPWKYRYQVPADCLLVQSIKQSGVQIDFDRYEDEIYTEVDNASTALILEYIWRVPEGQWPPYFVDAVIDRLEAVFMKALTNKEQASARREEEANAMFRIAKNLDATQQTTRRIRKGGVLAVR